MIDNISLLVYQGVIQGKSGTVLHHAIENFAHDLAVLPGRKVVKIQGQQVLLPGPAVTVAVGLVEPGVGEVMLLSVCTGFDSCLDLDIHRAQM